MTQPVLGPLDYVYAPSTDVPADARWFVGALGGHRLAVYELSRPGVVEAMAGQLDL